VAGVQPVDGLGNPCDVGQVANDARVPAKHPPTVLVGGRGHVEQPWPGGVLSYPDLSRPIREGLIDEQEWANRAEPAAQR
jgi:hypothetical protein